jgi:hypothetical protein
MEAWFPWRVDLMQRLEPLQLVDGAYLDDTRPYDSQDCVNYIPEVAENANARSPAILRGAPGMRLFGTVGNGPCRGARNVEGQLFVVSGTQLFQVDISGTGTLLGTIPGSGRVSMTHNQVAGGNQLLIVNGGSGFVWDTSNSTFTQVSDPDYPGARVADYIDGYLAQLQTDRKKWFHSDLNTALSYLGLDFYEAEALPDDIVSLMRVHSELWIFGQNSIQPFVNTGVSEGTFAPGAGTNIEQGCAGAFTPAMMDNSPFWLGSDGVVYRGNGYSPQRISTFALEQAISGLNWANAFSMTYEDRGHKIYYLTFPEENGMTWGYDAATQRWHRRQSYNLPIWRASALVFWQRQWIAGDFENGRLYVIDWNFYKENDRPLVASRKTAYLHDSQNTLFLSALELLMNTGAAATGITDHFVSLRYSDDGGRNWSNWKTVSLGAVGQYGKRVRFKRLGWFRNRVFEIQVSSPAQRDLLTGSMQMKAAA